MTPRALLLETLASAAHGFSMGSFGAIAEFSRDPGEPCRLPDGGRLGWITARGGLAFHWRDDLCALAWEGLSKPRDHWQHGVVFCLPRAAAMLRQHTGIAELGPDQGALRQADREGVLFDLGLRQGFVNVAVRTADEALLSELRAAAGSELLAPGNPILRAIIAAGPHRVFSTVIGRLEVYQPIGIERSPDGPHTHVLPKLLARGRAHAASVPVPEGWLPVLAAHPAHPCRTPGGAARPFEFGAHEQFQHWLRCAGPPGFVAQKQATWSALERGVHPTDFDPGRGRITRTATRVALRQYRHFGHGDSSLVSHWAVVFDGGRAEAQGQASSRQDIESGTKAARATSGTAS